MRYLLLLLPFFVFAQPREGMEHAEWVASQLEGGPVRVKSKTLLKFGKNTDLGTTAEMVWVQGGTEYLDYDNCNCIDSISSSNSGDNQRVIVEGHTISDGVVTFVSFADTLNGQTPVVLNTALWRLTRLYNDSDTDFAGDIYAYSGGSVTSGVPQVADSIHIKVLNTDNQSFKAATTLSSNDYWFITAITVGVEISGGSAKDVDFNLEVREYGKVFRRIFPVSATNTVGTVEITFDPAIIIKPRSDIRVTAVSSGANTVVEATINGYLAYVR